MSKRLDGALRCGAVSTLTPEGAVAGAYEQRVRAVADEVTGGRAYCHQLALATDAWVVALADAARSVGIRVVAPSR